MYFINDILDLILCVFHGIFILGMERSDAFYFGF